MTEPTETAPPPLPTLTGATPDTATASNEWRVLLESVALHAEKRLLSVNQTRGIGARSRFRSGIVRFSEEGIEIEGMAVPLLPYWLRPAFILVGLSIFLLELFFFLGGQVGLSIGFRRTVVIGLLPFLYAPALLINQFNNRRTETKAVLGWESVRALRVDPKLRFVTLVVSSFAVPIKPIIVRAFGRETDPPPALPISEFLTFGNLQPPVVEGVATTVEHYAPHIKREPTETFNPFVHWLTVVLIVLLGMFVLFIVIVVYRVGAKYIHP